MVNQEDIPTDKIVKRKKPSPAEEAAIRNQELITAGSESSGTTVDVAEKYKRRFGPGSSFGQRDVKLSQKAVEAMERKSSSPQNKEREVRIEAGVAKGDALEKVYGLLALEKLAWSNYSKPGIQAFIDALKGKGLFGGSLSKHLGKLEKDMARHNELVKSISGSYASRFIAKAYGRKSIITSGEKAGGSSKLMKTGPWWSRFMNRDYAGEKKVELPKSYENKAVRREFVNLEIKIDREIVSVQLEVKETDRELRNMLENAEKFTSTSSRLAALAGKIEIRGKSIEVLQSLAERNYDHVKGMVKLCQGISAKYGAFKKIFLDEFQTVVATWKIARVTRKNIVNLDEVKRLEEKVRIDISDLINKSEAFQKEAEVSKKDIRDLRQITRAMFMHRRNWFGRSWQRLRLAFG